MNDEEMLAHIDQRITEVLKEHGFGSEEHMMWVKARIELMNVMLRDGEF